MQYSTDIVFNLLLLLSQERALIYAIKICQPTLTLKPTFVVMPYRCTVQGNYWLIFNFCNGLIFELLMES